MEEALKSRIDGLVGEAHVVLFMKGTKVMPQCGFSARVVQILGEVGVPYETHNVLADPDLRDGIKVYSDWPTIPQLYVKGEFQGGCDIITEMYSKGELHELFGVEAPKVHTPSITVTEAAAAQLKSASEQSTESGLRLEVGAGFQHNLFFGGKRPNDVEVEAGGLTFFIPGLQGEKLEGLKLDYVNDVGGTGFKIDNPNAPPIVTQMSVQELKQRLDQGDKIHVFDVRPEDERAKAKLDFAEAADPAGAYLKGVGKDEPIVIHCYLGGRSQRAADELLKQGYRKVYNLSGGIKAWSQEIDNSVPIY